jgi:hypothetical protein
MEEYKKHVEILAAPEMEGRETGQPGQRKAAMYISDVFQRLGLKPMGDSGTYLQSYLIERERINPDFRFVVGKGKKAKACKLGQDVMTVDLRDTIITAGVVFNGFGKGKLTDKDHKKFFGKFEMTFVGKQNMLRDTTDMRILMQFFVNRESGSVGKILIADTATYGSIVLQYSKVAVFFEQGTSKLAGGKPFGGFKAAAPMYVISPAVADELLKSTGKTSDEYRKQLESNPDFKPIELKNTSVTIDIHTLREKFIAHNVIGLVEGSDTAKQKECIIYSAHYDHVGKTHAGAIYHGADDNASGTAAVLTMASAFKNNNVAPSRSILFLTVSGEEKGLLGSSFYIGHPSVPLAQTIADINFDQIGRKDAKYKNSTFSDYVYLVGSRRRSNELDSLLNAANTTADSIVFDYRYDDPNDKEQLYRRSDHWNFARNNIPIVFLTDGLHEDYHKPTDTADRIEYEKAVKIARLAFLTGWKLANLPHPLRINE